VFVGHPVMAQLPPGSDPDEKVMPIHPNWYLPTSGPRPTPLNSVDNCGGGRIEIKDLARPDDRNFEASSYVELLLVDDALIRTGDRSEFSGVPIEICVQWSRSYQTGSQREWANYDTPVTRARLVTQEICAAVPDLP
jgi:hypothetical protein